MLRNYLIVAVRNLLRHKVYSAINIVGLAVGMACCILILLFIQDELSYDRFHKNAGRIHRVLIERHISGTSPSYGEGTSGALAPALLKDFPEVQQAVRLFNMRGVWIRYKENEFAQRFCIADASFWDVFSFPLVKGDPKTALRDPFSIVMTVEMAHKYFGNEDPIGKVVKVDHRYFRGDYKVTGILRDIPPNSDFRFDFLTSTVCQEDARFAWEKWITDTSFLPVQTYVVLPEGYPSSELERKFPDFIARYMGKEVTAHQTYHLQPLTRIHLYSSVDYGIPFYGDITYTYMLSLIAFFILLIACINFMNLATARSAKRAKEVGVRKVIGAHRQQLVRQFLGESIFLSFLALLFALALVELARPALASFTEKTLSLGTGESGFVLLGLLCIASFVGILAGSYPALFLSAFQPVEVLKGTLKAGSKSPWLRKGLVVFQFSISIVLIVGTIIIHNQLEYIKNKNLGFNKEQVVILPLFARDRSLTGRYEAVKSEFLKHHNVLKVSASHSLPGWLESVAVRPEGTTGNEWQMPVLGVDEDFLETYEIELIAGRNFSKGFASDSTDAFILNETAVKQLGWTSPMGKQFEWPRYKRRGTVIGVVRDFHISSLHEQIGPAFICIWQPKFNLLSLRIRPDNIPATLDFLGGKWKLFIPNRPFEFSFLNDGLDRMYRPEMQLSRTFSVFSALAIFIACLGLFGLASFTAERRTKEIGIRKVLGASVPDIVLLLSEEFVKLVALANLIAWPVAYYAMRQWLQDFAYRIELGPGVFVMGGVLALGIALLTVSAQAIRAARANPVEALRYE